jgi:hypothetical protein
VGWYEYLIDVEEGKIALDPVEESTQDSYKSVKSDHSIQFSAGAVMREFGVDIASWNETKHFPVEKNGDQIIVDLSNILD